MILYDHGQVIENPALSGRVGFVGAPWSADMVLNNTRLSDSGTYRCVVNNPPEPGDPGIGELSLHVLGTTEGPVNVTRPSTLMLANLCVLKHGGRDLKQVPWMVSLIHCCRSISVLIALYWGSKNHSAPGPRTAALTWVAGVKNTAHLHFHILNF